MKWIGQHIVDLIARFRSDVYLEDLATTTEANVLVVDADGKVSKNTSVGGDITSIVAGTGLSGTDLTGPIPTLNVDAIQTQITQVGTLASLLVDNIAIDANSIFSIGDMTLFAIGNDVFVDSDNFIITSSTNDKPMIQLKATSLNTGPSELSFVKDKGTGGIDNDDIGVINFVSDNSTEEQTSFASITAEVSESLNTDEAGRLVFKVAESNGTESQLTTGLLIEGEHATDGEVDVTIAAGAASTTTVAGTLTMGSTATLDNSGNLLNNAAGLTASTSNAIGVGTIELGHASDTTIARSAAGVVTVEGNKIVTAGAINIDSEAQGANTIIEIVRITARVDRAATQSNSAADMNLHYAGKEPGNFGAASLSHFRRFAHGKTTDLVERRGTVNALTAVTLTEDVNTAVEVSFDSATTTNCFTSIDMYVSYFVIDVS